MDLVDVIHEPDDSPLWATWTEPDPTPQADHVNLRDYSDHVTQSWLAESSHPRCPLCGHKTLGQPLSANRILDALADFVYPTANNTDNK